MLCPKSLSDISTTGCIAKLNDNANLMGIKVLTSLSITRSVIELRENVFVGHDTTDTL